MNQNFYYLHGDHAIGPVSEERLSDLFKEGKLKSQDLVFKEGEMSWQSLNGFIDCTVQPVVSPVAAPPQFPKVQEQWVLLKRKGQGSEVQFEQKAQIPTSEIEQMIRDKSILAQDFLWKEGFAEWVPASEVEAFKKHFIVFPPPPPPKIAAEPVVKADVATVQAPVVQEVIPPKIETKVIKLEVKKPEVKPAEKIVPAEVKTQKPFIPRPALRLSFAVFVTGIVAAGLYQWKKDRVPQVESGPARQIASTPTEPVANNTPPPLPNPGAARAAMAAAAAAASVPAVSATHAETPASAPVAQEFAVLFPVPLTLNDTIEFVGGKAQAVRVSLLAEAGQVLGKIRFSETRKSERPTSEKWLVDLSEWNLVEGFYKLSVEGEGVQYSQKVTIGEDPEKLKALLEVHRKAISYQVQNEKKQLTKVSQGLVKKVAFLKKAKAAEFSGKDWKRELKALRLPQMDAAKASSDDLAFPEQWRQLSDQQSQLMSLGLAMGEKSKRAPAEVRSLRETEKAIENSAKKIGGLTLKFD